MKAYVIKTGPSGSCETCYEPGGGLVAVLLDEKMAHDYKDSGNYEMEDVEILTELPDWVKRVVENKARYEAEKEARKAARAARKAAKR